MAKSKLIKTERGLVGSAGPMGPTGPAGSPGFVNMKQAEIDFGNEHTNEMLFIVDDEDATSNSIVMATVAMQAIGDKDIDDITMDSIEIKACGYNGEVHLHVRGLEGYLHGKFVINYVVH